MLVKNCFKNFKIGVIFTLCLIICLTILNFSSLNDNKVVLSASEYNGSMHTAYMSGYSDGTFRPNETVSRALVADILAKLDVRFNSTTKAEYVPTFTDIPDNYWARNSIGFCQKLGILSGQPNGTFGPTEEIKRSEFIVSIIKYQGIDYKNKKSKFTDVKGRWMEPYVGALEELGYLSGYANGTCGIDKKITRAELCALLNKVLDRPASAEMTSIIPEQIKFSDVKEGSWYYWDVIEATNAHRSNIAH